MASISSKAHQKSRPSATPQNTSSNNNNWMAQLSIKYLVDPQHVFRRPTGKEALAPAAWNKKLHYPLDIGDWTWMHVLSLVFPEAHMDVKSLYGLLFRHQVCVKLDMDPTTKGPVEIYVPESFMEDLKKMSSEACVTELKRFLDKLPTEQEYNDLVKNGAEVGEFIGRHIHYPRMHPNHAFPVDVSDEMASTYAFHIYANEYNVRKNPKTGTYTTSRVDSETFPSSLAPVPISADGTAYTPTQIMVSFINRVTNHKLVVGGSNDGNKKDDWKKSSGKGQEDGGEFDRKIVLSPRNCDVAQDVKYGKKRVTSISFVPQTMMYFRGGLFYQSYNPSTNQYTRTTPNPAEHIVFNSLDANSRLGTDISSLYIDKNFGVPTGIAIGVLLLEFACGPDHAMVIRGSSKIMVRPEPSLKVVASAAKKVCVTLFSFRDGYESFANVQTRFITQFSSGGASSELSPSFNWYVTPEQQREYLSLPPQVREKARVLLARAAMLPKIMDATGKTRFTTLWTPKSIGKQVDDIFKGVCLLNFSFFVHKQEVGMRNTVGPIICAKAAPAYSRVVEGIDDLDMPLPSSVVNALSVSNEEEKETREAYEFSSDGSSDVQLSSMTYMPTGEGEEEIAQHEDEHESSEGNGKEEEEEEDKDNEEDDDNERVSGDDDAIQERIETTDAKESSSEQNAREETKRERPRATGQFSKKRPASAHGDGAKRSKKINL